MRHIHRHTDSSLYILGSIQKSRYLSSIMWACSLVTLNIGLLSQGSPKENSFVALLWKVGDVIGERVGARER